MPENSTNRRAPKTAFHQKSGASVANSANVEFVDAPALRERFSIKRGTAYRLLNEGLIRGASLGRPGSKRSKRLFEVASVRAYLTSQMEVSKS